ncbi:MAG TPA: hypothetical protein DCO75_06105 [Fibrobacteres bacterium]|nr:hypothetical protein [Fibrobacterota bacterium]
MLLFMSKLFAAIIYPVGLFCVLSLITLIFLLFKKYKRAMFFLVLSILPVWLFSTPAISHYVVRSLESKFDPPAVFPHVPAIVVLGGSTQAATPPRRYVETNECGDRIFHALRLVKAHYAPLIICTGGRISFLNNSPGSEAADMACLLREFGNNDSTNIIIEDKAQNTHDHGPKVMQIFKKRGLKKEIILVTSAMHMYRSVKVFEKAGFVVHPAPTDYWKDKNSDVKFFSFMPNANDLEASTAALHEYYGMLAYWFMGWI